MKEEYTIVLNLDVEEAIEKMNRVIEKANEFHTKVTVHRARKDQEK